MSSANPGIHGGIPGSYPIWGDYIYLGLTNWAAKFFIDALTAKTRLLSTLLADVPARSIDDRLPLEDLPHALPPLPESTARHALTIVMYSGPDSRKVRQMVTAWSSWGFAPAAVVIERRGEPGPLVRVARKVRDEGFGWLWRRLLARRARGDRNAPNLDLASFCRGRGIPVVDVGPLDSAGAVAAVRALQPDLAIHAGAGLLRAPLLAIPRLGTLNAHMGILPHYRGMNVAEWASVLGGPVGCTAHVIDAGIDTGDILCVRRVSPAGVSDIASLRDRVDRAQIDLLGEVVRFVLETGHLPPRRRQAPEEGSQFFRMHAEIAAALETSFAWTNSTERRQGVTTLAPVVAGDPL
jgi:hypothetical protein